VLFIYLFFATYIRRLYSNVTT